MADDKNISITYEFLYELLRKEKFRKELQKLDENFFKDVINYLEEKKAILMSQEKKDSIFAPSNVQKTRKQLENLQKIIKEFYERRETKIIQLAVFSSRTNAPIQDYASMLEEEKEFYKTIVEELNNYRSSILKSLLEGKLPVKGRNKKKQKDAEPVETKLIRFMQAIPQFVGDDLEVYGPFESEDISNLPTRVAEVLIKNNRAEEL